MGWIDIRDLNGLALTYRWGYLRIPEMTQISPAVEAKKCGKHLFITNI